MKRLVYTTTWGSFHQSLSELTHPLIQRYAHNHGADFLVVSDKLRIFPEAHASYEDFQLPRWLDTWDQIVHLDTDLVIANDTPWLLDQSGGTMCAVDESYFEDRMRLLDSYAIAKNLPKLKYSRYFNLGVFGLTRDDSSLWQNPNFWNEDNMGHQTPINYKMASQQHRVRDLGPDFNSMVFSWPRYSLETAYIAHFAGMRELSWVMEETHKMIAVLKQHGRA